MKIKKILAGIVTGTLIIAGTSTVCFARTGEDSNVETVAETEQINLSDIIEEVEREEWAEEAEKESGDIPTESTSVSEPDETHVATPLTPDGNLTLVDDIGSASGAGQQFITVITKSGNYFYLIIDRDDKGEENVHFLNLVDEADLFALMDEEQIAAYQGTQDAALETEDAGKLTPTTEVDDSDETNAAENDQDDTQEQTSNPVTLSMAFLIGIVGIGGGVYYLVRGKKKKESENKPDPDADYVERDEEYVIPMDSEEEDRESV